VASGTRKRGDEASSHRITVIKWRSQ